MAKQRGEVILKGKLGSLSFYGGKYGYIARTIGEVSKEKFRNDPKQAARKDAALEFGYASGSGKRMRLAVQYCFASAEVGSTHYRLNKVIGAATKHDAVNKRGERRLMPNNVGMLKGFNWRADEPVHLSIRWPYKVGLDVNGGTATLDIAGMVPARDVRMGDGATHLEITLVLAAMDDKKLRPVVTSAVSGKLDVLGDEVTNINLNCALPAGSGKIWMAGIGVQGFQEVNGEMMPLSGGGGFEIGEMGMV